MPKYSKDNAAYFRNKESNKEDTLSKAQLNQIVQAIQATSKKPPKGRQQALIQNGEYGYIEQGSSWQPKEEVTKMLQSMTIATANVMNVDAILDSGATASIFFT